MATSSNHSDPPTPSSSDTTDSRHPSPTDSTRLMSTSSSRPDSESRYEVHRWVFAAPESMHGGRRFHSPRIYTRSRSPRSISPRILVRSVSEDVGINSQWRQDSYHGDHTKSTSVITGSRPSSPNEDQPSGVRTPLSSRPPSRHSRSASHGSSVSVPQRAASFLSEIRPGAILSRSSTRRSLGREWTRNHWEKVRDLEEESERAKRCSKLSSGFAPLMVFGGLVFICIGVSAATNTGKDQERLKNLSAAPMAMGVFMLVLGVFLIATWFGCRGRARRLEQRLLHGSRRNSVEDNLVQSLIAKLSATNGINRAQNSSPVLPGVTLDGVDVLKPQPDNEVRRIPHLHSVCTPESSQNGCCSHCGATNQTTHVVLETSI